MKITNELSASLMVANLISTILVVAIHYSSKSYANVDSFNYIFQEYVTNGLARVSVPYFSFITGFFLVDKLNGDKGYVETLKVKFRTLLIPYCLASTLIFIFSTLLIIVLKPALYKPTDLISIIHTIIINPISVQFWYLRDIIILVIASPILFNINSRFRYIFLSTLFFLWIVDAQLFPIIGRWYLVSIETLFYFFLGGVIYYRENFILFIFNMNKVIKLLFFFILIFLNMLRVYIYPEFDLWYEKKYTLASLLLYKTVIVLGLISLIHLSSALAKYNKIITLSGLTFFVFLFHVKPLYFIHSIFTSMFESQEYLFYLEFPLVLLITFCAALLCQKYCPKLYKLITGDRSSTKSMKRLSSET